jgi:hypothetical protein
MLHNIEDARTIDEDEPTARTVAIFGWARRGSDITTALTRGLHLLVDSDEVIRAAEGRYAPARTL